MKLGVYVGTFDPVHKGHIGIVNHLLKHNYVDKVIIIATDAYWDKQNILPTIDRINMLKCYENDNIIIDDSLNHLPYTYQILNELKNNFDVDLHLIIGSDNLYKFEYWDHFSEILQNKILVLPRNNDDCEKLINKFSNKEQFIIVKDFTIKNISSTKIREYLLNENYYESLSFLDSDVLEYIIANDLYKKKKSKQLVNTLNV